ncbi:Uncharacterised protein [Enterobacter cancerogenus]|uniref:Uncharacterized protein n=1 Tax=Enterobacter cancerogenus TaxID=69218 RepID=A0A484XCT7_9ENTR|nr:Uncharacterised protein [Enterobacter cancerogenus]
MKQRNKLLIHHLLLRQNNIPVDFKVKKIDQDSVNIFSDYKSLLEYRGEESIS